MADEHHRPGHQRILPHELLDRMRWEITAADGLAGTIPALGWPEISSRECGQIGGRIGGRMVKVMIRYAEESLAHGGART